MYNNNHASSGGTCCGGRFQKIATALALTAWLYEIQPSEGFICQRHGSRLPLFGGGYSADTVRVWGETGQQEGQKRRIRWPFSALHLSTDANEAAPTQLENESSSKESPTVTMANVSFPLKSGANDETVDDEASLEKSLSTVVNNDEIDIARDVHAGFGRVHEIEQQDMETLERARTLLAKVENAVSAVEQPNDDDDDNNARRQRRRRRWRPRRKKSKEENNNDNSEFELSPENAQSMVDTLANQAQALLSQIEDAVVASTTSADEENPYPNGEQEDEASSSSSSQVETLSNQAKALLSQIEETTARVVDKQQQQQRAKVASIDAPKSVAGATNTYDAQRALVDTLLTQIEEVQKEAINVKQDQEQWQSELRTAIQQDEQDNNNKDDKDDTVAAILPPLEETPYAKWIHAMDDYVPPAVQQRLMFFANERTPPPKSLQKTNRPATMPDKTIRSTAKTTTTTTTPFFQKAVSDVNNENVSNAILSGEFNRLWNDDDNNDSSASNGSVVATTNTTTSVVPAAEVVVSTLSTENFNMTTSTTTTTTAAASDDK